MLDMLRGTPLWVYAIFLIVTYLGVVACFENHESKRSLQISPVVFTGISLASLNFVQGFAFPVLVYFIAMLAGLFLAARFYSFHNVHRDGKHLVLGGSVKVLLVYWSFFAWRYYSGYQETTRPERINDVATIVASALASGAINGLIVGRSLRLLRFFKPGVTSLT